MLKLPGWAAKIRKEFFMSSMAKGNLPMGGDYGLGVTDVSLGVSI